MEEELQKAVEEILQSQEKAEKRLTRKVEFIILSMILLLTTIIIVEFKEYSHNYTEYKIGLKELGPKDLVWAGIMGSPPRYYESNEKHGLGYREFDTREIRKALEEAGINLVYRYMSPNRLEFEFERKHPICFYDRKWSNPKEYFKKKRHPILSIPLYYSGNETKKIFFRKGEKARFEKHLDSKGKIILDSLIKDPSLKTELIRKVEYDGPYANITYGKRQQDGTYYDYVKQEYKKNIDLVILHTNDQIIQMLRWKRLDYQFFDTIEYDDYPWMDGGEKGIETLTYENKVVKTIDDPNLIFHSVACGNHPLGKMAMPIINEVIKSLRISESNYRRAQENEAKLNPLSPRPVFFFYAASGNQFGNTIYQTDDWYFYQFTKLKIDPWPLLNKKIEISPLEIDKNLEMLSNSSPTKNGPMWNLIEKKNLQGEKTLLIIHDVDIKEKREEDLLKNKFFDPDYKDETRLTLDKKKNFADLVFPKENSIQKIIIFARGIKDKEFEMLKPFIHSSFIKSITLSESSPNQSKILLEYLPEQLEHLRLFDVPLMGLFFSKSLAKLKMLKEIDIQAYPYDGMPLWLEDREIISMLKVLPNNLESFSLVGIKDINITAFPYNAAEVFSKRQFSKLTKFTLQNFYIDFASTKLILDSLPLSLESLILGTYASIESMVNSLLLEEFLNARKQMNTLKRLHLYNMIFSLHQNNKITLPESLEDFLLLSPIGLKDGNFHRIIIPPKMKLKNLTISKCELNDYSLVNFLHQLDTNVENLVIENSKLTGHAFFLLKNSLNIEKLSLNSNPINDFGIFSLSRLPWKIKELSLSNLKITDDSLNYLYSKTFSDLHSLNLGNNSLSASFINKVLLKYGENLVSLNLSNVTNLDIKFLSTHISSKLDFLSLEGNMISDNEISLLIPALPKNLSYLNISGSRLSAKAAITIARQMPNLSRFYFDFKFGEEEEGFSYILKSLSPYLFDFSMPVNILSYKNTQLLSLKMPELLFNLELPEFEKEECKIILSSISNALRIISFNGNIKSKGKSLTNLLTHYPSQLLRIRIGDVTSIEERDFFLHELDHKYIKLTPGKYATYSKQFVKTSSFYTFLGNGAQKTENFKDIVLPASVSFYSFQANDIPKGFLDSLKSSQLINLRFFILRNGKNLEAREIIDFAKKLPATFSNLILMNTNLKIEDIDSFIEHLPKNLKILSIPGNSFGQEELKKFRIYKQKMEEKTGLPFLLYE